jgi:hypothetical protein
MDKNDLKLFLLEALLLELEVGGAKNYIPVQLLVLFLASNLTDIKNLNISDIKDIATAYPIAVSQTVGDRTNLDTLHVPPLNMQNKDKVPEIWNSLPDNEKEVIKNIYNHVLSITKKVA